LGPPNAFFFATTEKPHPQPKCQEVVCGRGAKEASSTSQLQLTRGVANQHAWHNQNPLISSPPSWSWSSLFPTISTIHYPYYPSISMFLSNVATHEWPDPPSTGPTQWLYWNPIGPTDQRVPTFDCWIHGPDWLMLGHTHAPRGTGVNRAIWVIKYWIECLWCSIFSWGCV